MNRVAREFWAAVFSGQPPTEERRIPRPEHVKPRRKLLRRTGFEHRPHRPA